MNYRNTISGMCDVTSVAEESGRGINCVSTESLSAPASKALERAQALSMLALRMAGLPSVAKKVLAMYFHENLSIRGIAACLELPQWQIEEILRQTIGLLQNDLAQISGTQLVP